MTIGGSSAQGAGLGTTSGAGRRNEAEATGQAEDDGQRGGDQGDRDQPSRRTATGGHQVVPSVVDVEGYDPGSSRIGSSMGCGGGGDEGLGLDRAIRSLRGGAGPRSTSSVPFASSSS